ncbi:NEDD8-specific protease 2 [Colletotrichum spaethianum]|uniref:NEDD8-specific protease 2 n=1 Tax=Colletotrichum spaethianum TaxID=700344 RepID=A0AA37L4N8_9PEZI|nr:NEDD8-specific protease 2 [Colletotrichum spaethianum]GKT40494.1 NEDD8-specific protease 2 [Colletotrichum spaethianum]
MARHFGDTVRPFLARSPPLALPSVLFVPAALKREGVVDVLYFSFSHVGRRPDGQAHASRLARPARVALRAVAAGVPITYEDIKALKNDWLTDNNIAFWEEWLEREILPKYPQARICLLRPSMTFLLMKEPDMRQIRSALPDFSKTTHIFLPINDARNVAQAEGGSHWSLLLVSAIDGVAFHYDSLGGANYAEGRLATHKMAEILGRPLRYLNLEDSPQQENGSDCGVFVCILMRHLLVKRLLSANAREKVSMSMANKLIDSHGGRKEMLKIIESLRKEGERRRS